MGRIVLADDHPLFRHALRIVIGRAHPQLIINEAETLAARLKPVAARRDAALLAAQMCADQQSWPCAREHADEALALDTGSDPAKTILERVIRETGWAPLNPQSTTSTKATRQVAHQ